MCGIAGIIHRGKVADIGDEMMAMLQAMKHRGPDSSGFSLYGRPAGDELVMRFKVAEQEDLRRGLEIHRQIQERRADVDARIRSLGGQILAADEATEYAFRYRIRFDGDLRRLADQVEDVEGAEILSIGAALELIKDLGDARHVGCTVPRWAGSSARTPSATSAWRPNRTWTSARLIPSGPIPSEISPSSTTASSPTTGASAGAGAQGASVHVQLRLRTHRGLPGRQAERQFGSRGRHEGFGRGTRRRLHLRGGDLGQPRNGQGRDGGQADGALRGRRLHRPRFGGDGHSQHLPSRDRHLRPLRRRSGVWQN